MKKEKGARGMMKGPRIQRSKTKRSRTAASATGGPRRTALLLLPLMVWLGRVGCPNANPSPLVFVPHSISLQVNSPPLQLQELQPSSLFRPCTLPFQPSETTAFEPGPDVGCGGMRKVGPSSPRGTGAQFGSFKHALLLAVQPSPCRHTPLPSQQ